MQFLPSPVDVLVRTSLGEPMASVMRRGYRRPLIALLLFGVCSVVPKLRS
jgi:hypothetical protein